MVHSKLETGPSLRVGTENDDVASSVCTLLMGLPRPHGVPPSRFVVRFYDLPLDLGPYSGIPCPPFDHLA